MLPPFGGRQRRLLLTWLAIQSLVLWVFASVVFLVKWARLASRRYRRPAASHILSAATLAYSSATSLSSTPPWAGVHRRVTGRPRAPRLSATSMMALARVCLSPTLSVWALLSAAAESEKAV